MTVLLSSNLLVCFLLVNVFSIALNAFLLFMVLKTHETALHSKEHLYQFDRWSTLAHKEIVEKLKILEGETRNSISTLKSSNEEKKKWVNLREAFKFSTQKDINGSQ